MKEISTKQRDEEWVEGKENKWQMLKNTRRCKEGKQKQKNKEQYTQKYK